MSDNPASVVNRQVGILRDEILELTSLIVELTNRVERMERRRTRQLATKPKPEEPK